MSLKFSLNPLKRQQTYDVHYVGCMEIYKSLNTVDGATRTQLCREIIERCHAVNADRKLKTRTGFSRRRTTRKEKKSLKAFIGDSKPVTISRELQRADLELRITPEGLTTYHQDSLEVVNIYPRSTVTCVLGDKEGSKYEDYITFVTKIDSRRFMHVFDCGLDAANVVASVKELFYAQQRTSRSMSESRAGSVSSFGLPGSPIALQRSSTLTSLIDALAEEDDVTGESAEDESEDEEELPYDTTMFTMTDVYERPAYLTQLIASSG